MTVQEQIEKEFNKDKNSYIDLYLILDLLISQKNREPSHKTPEEKFLNSEFVQTILSLSKKNPDKFKVYHRSLVSGTHQSLDIVIENDSGIEKFDLIHNLSLSGDNNFMLEHNKNNIQRRLYFINELKSTFKIPLKPPLKTPYERQYYFQFNITSNIKDDLIKREYITSSDKDEQLNSIFSTIGNSINNKQSLSETFDLLNMQYDFSGEEFKKSINYFFVEENSTTKHDNLLLKIKKNNENKNKIKLNN